MPPWFYRWSAFRRKVDQRNDHFFHRDAAVLKGVEIIVREIVEVVRIDEIIGVLGKNVAGADIP